MALAMLPPPMKAMWCEVVMSGVPCVSDTESQSGNCRFLLS